MTTVRQCRDAVARSAANLRGLIGVLEDLPRKRPEAEIAMRRAHLVDLEAAERLLSILLSHPSEVKAILEGHGHVSTSHTP